MKATTDVWCINARGFVYHCCDLTNKIVIFVNKAVPTLLVNYLLTKNEKNRLSEPFKTVISLERIPSQESITALSDKCKMGFP